MSSGSSGNPCHSTSNVRYAELFVISVASISSFSSRSIREPVEMAEVENMRIPLHWIIIT